jgi:hypothetical protein
MTLELPDKLASQIAEKKLSEKELMIIKDLSEAPKHYQESLSFFKHLADQRLTRQQLALSLEWGGELILFNRAPNWADISNDFFSSLKRLRFKQTNRSDHQQAEFWKGLNWPKGVKQKWTRVGDKAHLEVSFTVTELSELMHTSERLHCFAKKLSEESQHATSEGSC